MKRCLAIAGINIPMLLLAAVTFAAEAEHGHHDPGVPFGTIIFSTINLALFVYILARSGVPLVRQWVQDRRDQIVKELEEAAAARGEAVRLKAEWEQRIAKLDETIREMREQAKRDTERERERILADAHKVAEGIQRDAEKTIAAELRGMRSELRAKVVREAIHLAENEVRKQWTAADQDRFVSEFVRQVGK